MMREEITTALVAAMKAQDKRRVSTLRLVTAAIKDREIAARGTASTEIGDSDILELLAKMIKQREESRAIYADAGRPDLAQQEAEEIAIIREFLPSQLSEDEMRKAVDEVAAELGASSIKDMGKVMGALKARYAGRMDFAKAGALVKQRLG